MLWGKTLDPTCRLDSASKTSIISAIIRISIVNIDPRIYPTPRGKITRVNVIY